MELSKALTEAMRESGLSDEMVAVQAGVSFYTVQSARTGRVKRPQRLVLEALRRVVPGLAERLDSTAVA